MTSQAADRRRRCRRHLHRPVLLRPGRAPSAPPRSRPTAATRLSASSNGLRALGGRRGVRLHRPRHHRRHQRAAGTQGRADRRHHHARLPRRAGDAPARPAASTWGLWGDFMPDRRPRHADRGRRSARSPTARSTRGSMSPRCRGGARPRRARRAGARHHLHQQPTPTPPTSARAGGRRAPSGRTPHVSDSSEILPEIREFERASTTALNAYLQPVVGSLPRHGSKRRWTGEASRAVPHRAVQWRRHVDARPRASCRCARRCRARPPASSRRGDRARGRLSTTSSPAISAAPRSTSR